MEQRQILSSGTSRKLDLSRDAIARALSRRPARRFRSDVGVSRHLSEGVPLALDGTPPRTLTPAAVLVPLVERAWGTTVLLTRRSAHLANHAGQISFPGGHVEPSDQDATATALRETEEEIGLAGERVAVVGRLDDYVTTSGFLIAPMVGFAQPPFTLTPDPKEVDEIFEVPLTFVLDPANHQRREREDGDGARRYFFAIPYGEKFIWGATAAMLVNLSEILRPPCVS